MILRIARVLMESLRALVLAAAIVLVLGMVGSFLGSCAHFMWYAISFGWRILP